MPTPSTDLERATADSDKRMATLGMPTYSELLRALRDLAEFAERFADLAGEPRGGSCRAAIGAADALIDKADARIALDEPMAFGDSRNRNQREPARITWELSTPGGGTRTVTFSSVDGAPRDGASREDAAVLFALHSAGWREGALGNASARFVRSKSVGSA